MEKLKIFKATVFVDDSVRRPDPTHGIGSTGAIELFLPIEAISHLTNSGSHGSYKIHIKKNYPLNLPFLIKSIQASNLSADQIELIG